MKVHMMTLSRIAIAASALKSLFGGTSHQPFKDFKERLICLNDEKIGQLNVMLNQLWDNARSLEMTTVDVEEDHAELGGEG